MNRVYTGMMALDANSIALLKKLLTYKIGLIPPILPGLIAEIRKENPFIEIYIVDLEKTPFPLCDEYRFLIEVLPEEQKYPTGIQQAIEKYEYHRTDPPVPLSPLESLEKNHKRYKNRRYRRD